MDVTIDSLVIALSAIAHKSATADKDVVRLLCTAPAATSLTLAQKRAMHVFLHETLAALNRLYVIVPKDRADPIINKVLEPFNQP